MPATEPEFQSFIDRLDMMFSRRTAKESDYMQSLGERMESALGEGFGALDSAVEEFEASVSEISTGSGPAIESIVTFTETFENSTEEVQENQEELVEGFGSRIEEDLSLEETETEEPGGQDSISEKIELGLETGFESLDNAIDKFGASVSEISSGSVIESITTSTESVEDSTEEMKSVQDEVIEGLEGKSDEELDAEEIVPQIEGIAEQTGESVQENVDRVNELFQELASKTDTSEQELEELRSSFSDFQNDIVEIQKQVEEEEVKTSQVRSQITAAVENIQTDIETTFGGGEKAQEAVSGLKEMPDLIADQISAGKKQGSIAETAADPELYGAGAEVSTIAFEQVQEYSDSGFLTKLSGVISEIKNVFLGGALATAVTSLAAPIGIAVDLLEDAYNNARQFREETGIGTERMKELRELTASTSTELARFGLDPEDTVDIMNQFREQFGSINSASQRFEMSARELNVQTAAIAKGFALSGQEAAKLQGKLENIEASTGISRKNLLVNTRELARQKDVAPQAVMQQISQNSEALAKFAGSSSRRLAEAAVEAERLGTSLESATSFQEQALGDITGTVEQIQQIGMATGQAFDSASLIQASFKGAAATAEEVKEQVQGISAAEFENMNEIQKMQLAELPGYDRSEIRNIIQGKEALEGVNTTAEKAQKIAEGELSFQQAITEGSGDRVGKLQNRLNALYFTVAEKLFPVVQDLADVLIPTLKLSITVLTPVIKGFTNAIKITIDAISSLINVMTLDFSEAKQEIMSIGQTLGLVETNSEGAKESVSLLTQTVKVLGGALGALAIGKAVSSLSGLVTTLGQAAIPAITSSLAAVQSFGLYLTTFSGTILPAVGSALTAATNAVLGFAGTLGATGIGAIILGIGAAVSGLVYAFYNWEETVQFVTNTINSFGESLFGVKNLSSKLSEGFSTLGNWLSWLGGKFVSLVTTVGEFYVEMYQLDHIFNFVADAVGYVSNLVSKFYEGKSAGEAFGSTLAVALNPIKDMVSYVSELVGLFYNLGTAIYEGNFSQLDEILLNGLSSIGSELIDLIIPDWVQSGIAEKMKGIGGTIMDHLTQSPAKEGPLSNIEDVDVGGTIAKQIQPEPVKQEMEKTTSVVQETAEQGMNVEPAQQDVATVQTPQPQQQQQTTEAQTSVDVDDVGIKKLLQQIKQGQQQLIQSLKAGEIAVYLDGRKVNKELLRSAGFSGK